MSGKPFAYLIVLEREFLATNFICLIYIIIFSDSVILELVY